MDIRARVHVRAHIEYMCVCLCAHVRTFGETLPHPGIVNSLLTKLLNGVTTRAKAFSFFFFFAVIFLFLPPPIPLHMPADRRWRIGNKYFIFHSGGHQ